jgi:hypothetical protein
MSILLTWVYNSTGGSLLMVVLLHATFNLPMTLAIDAPAGYKDDVARVRDDARRHLLRLGDLVGYGAEAINPYLAFETIDDMHARGELPAEVEAEQYLLAVVAERGR